MTGPLPVIGGEARPALFEPAAAAGEEPPGRVVPAPGAAEAQAVRGSGGARRVRMLALVTSDVVAFAACVLGAFVAGSALRNAATGQGGYLESGGPHQLVLVFGPAFAILLWRSWSDGHYSRFLPTWVELHGLLKSALTLAAVTTFVLFSLRSHFSRLWFGAFLVALVCAVPLARALTKRLLIRRGLWFRPTWIVGAGEHGPELAAAVESDASLGHRVVGYVEDDASVATASDGRRLERDLPSPGSSDAADVSFVFAYESLAEYERHRDVLDAHLAANASVTFVPPRGGVPMHDVEIASVYRHETTLLRVRNNIANPRARFVKRVVDIGLGGTLLLLGTPVLVALGALVRADGGPAFYRHRRIGTGGAPFDCLKFRSMRPDADELLAAHLRAHPTAAYEWRESRKLRYDPRLTRVGALLRSTSLDELPQLWNVVRGEMSLVGPRPIVEAEREHYGVQLPYYLQMVPGITGLWQVSGRSETSYPQRVALDVWYARHWSLWTDLVILVQTLPALLARRGAY